MKQLFVAKCQISISQIFPLNHSGKYRVGETQPEDWFDDPGDAGKPDGD